MKLEDYIKAYGERKAALAMIDNRLRKMTGVFTTSDLPDTFTLMNGLDEIEELLKDKQFDDARTLAREVADDMLAEEGMD